MRRSITTLLCLLLATLWLSLANATQAISFEFKVIVHPDNPISSVSRAFLRGAYLKQVRDWRKGLPVQPIDLSKRFPARDAVAAQVLQKSPAQLRSFWIQRIFSGTGMPPPELDSPAAVIASVLAQPGAVAYLPSNVDPGRAKVIKLE